MANKKADTWIRCLSRAIAMYENAANNLSVDEFKTFWSQIENERSKVHERVLTGFYQDKTPVPVADGDDDEN